MGRADIQSVAEYYDIHTYTTLYSDGGGGDGG